MSKLYIEQRDGGYWVTGTRVSLDSSVYAFLGGQTAEGIAQAFPVLTLEQVYGAITFYLANRPDIDTLPSITDRSQRWTPGHRLTLL